jgi:hypothetical protein
MAKKRKKYAVENVEAFYLAPLRKNVGKEFKGEETEDNLNFTYGENKEDLIEQLRDKSIACYRMKKIYSGPMLEIEIFPLWKTPRKKKLIESSKTREAQHLLNKRNAQKNIVRLTNTNFAYPDIWITVGYDKDHLPVNQEAALKEMQNYIRRLKRICKKNGWPELKYIYVTEYFSDLKNEEVRVHQHMIANFPDRDLAEQTWKNGNRPQARRLVPDDYGLEGLARYITKDVHDSKRVCTSRNLVKPEVRINDSKINRRKAERVAQGEILDNEFFEGLEKFEYDFTDVEIKRPDPEFENFVSGCYIYARLRKKKEINGRAKVS